MGGSRSKWHNSPANLITLCHRCHLYHVERRRLDAQLHGWAIRHGIQDPSSIPVLWHGQWVLLDHDGGYALDPGVGREDGG
jgi:hypothetical protein